jgi:hypothetical protein
MIRTRVISISLMKSSYTELHCKGNRDAQIQRQQAHLFICPARRFLLLEPLKRK